MYIISIYIYYIFIMYIHIYIMYIMYLMYIIYIMYIMYLMYIIYIYVYYMHIMYRERESSLNPDVTLDGQCCNMIWGLNSYYTGLKLPAATQTLPGYMVAHPT